MSLEGQVDAGPEDGGEIGFLDLVLVLAENLVLLIVVPLVAGLIALGIGFMTTPTFTATARILPPLQQQSASAMLATQLGALAGFASGVSTIRTPSDQYVALLKSGPVLDAMIARFKLKELWSKEFMVDARRSLAGRTKVSVGAKDGIITIEVDDDDPKRAATFANAYVEELSNLLNTLAVTEPQQRRMFFEAQLKQAKDNLTKSEIALRGSGINEATLRTVPQSALEALARIKAQITAQEIKLASMRGSMTESNPDFRLAQRELAALQGELTKAEQSNTGKPQGEGGEYIAKYRDFKYHETLFEMVAKQYEAARIDEAREGAVIQVLEVAQPPERKSRPKKAVNAVLTTLAMFFVMVVFVIARHAMRSMARDEGTAEKLARLRRLLLFQRR